MNVLNRNVLNRASRDIGPTAWLMCAAVFCVGCGDPINEMVVPSVSSSSVQLTTSGNLDRYEWPLNRDSYVVAKPPQMAYVTSFAEKLSTPDPVGAELVPWSNEGLGEDIQDFLRLGYDPPSPELRPTVTLTKSQFHGENAFDVSSDGTRMVVIDDEGLAMFRTDDGKLIGHMKLPSEVSSSPTPPTAVRFAGNTKDMLLASSEMIYRISSKDGTIIGQIQGCGEPIAQWHVTADDKTMLIRSESGRLFGGDPQLDYFAAYDFGKNVTFDQASLSLDGSRIGVVVNNKPKTYTQDAFQVVDEATYNNATLDPGSISIALGNSSDAWADGDGIFYTAPNDDGGRRNGIFHMFWKPLRMAATESDETHSSNLIVGRRFADGKEQLALFAFGPLNRNNSVPHRLDEVPTRMALNDSGTVVALADSKGLRVVRREAWVTTGMPFPNDWVYDLVNEGRFEEVVRMLKIVKTQKRLAYGRTPEEIRSATIKAMASRWRWLDKNDPDGETFGQLKEWRKEGSPLAILCSAIRHYWRGWNERGSGTAGTVTSAGWDEFHKRLKLCSGELEQLFEIESEPPLTAFERRIQAALEQEGDLSKVDSLCRRAMELYPGGQEPHQSISHKLTPQWYGEPGDVLSYVLSVSKMMKGAESDLLYVRLMGTACGYVSPQSKYEWNSYDRNKLVRGIDEAIRRKSYSHGDLWMLWRQFTTRTRDAEAADRVVKHLMEVVAAAPQYMDRQSQPIHQTAQRLRKK